MKTSQGNPDASLVFLVTGGVPCCATSPPLQTSPAAIDRALFLFVDHYSEDELPFRGRSFGEDVGAVASCR